MADPLYELLVPYLDTKTTTSFPTSPAVTKYLSRLATLSLSDLSTTEPQSLAQASNSHLVSLQALSSRSHKSVIATANALSTLHECLPALTCTASHLRDGVPELDEKAVSFSQKYSKSNTENEVLDRRKKAMLLARNVDRVSDILELPTLLGTAIASSSTPTTSSGPTPNSVNYSQALDLFAYIKRLQILHPDSALIQSVLTEAEEAMKDMASNLIICLRSQNIRLAAAIRTIGWLKRVAPELSTQGLPPPSAKSAQGSKYSTSLSSIQTTSDGSFGYLFLTCRLYNLISMLEALTPLRDLADQETQQRLQKQNSPAVSSSLTHQTDAQTKARMSALSASAGQQTERYLKRYVEIFREQSFGTVSMYKNIFPAASDDTTTTPSTTSYTQPTPSSTRAPHPAPGAAPAPPPLLPLPTPLSTFPSHLISMLTETLQQYLPNLRDSSARDSLLMQVLYAAGSLGRLGADFSMIISSLLDDGDEVADARDQEESSVPEQPAAEVVVVEEESNNSAQPEETAEIGRAPKPKPEPEPEPERKDERVPEWIRIVKKHRLQSSRLEALSASSPSSSSSPSRHQGREQGREQGQKQKQKETRPTGSSSPEAVVK